MIKSTIHRITIERPFCRCQQYGQADASRNGSAEGLDLTRKITKILVEKNFVVVSSLAKGIDTQVHKTALELKSNTQL